MIKGIRQLVNKATEQLTGKPEYLRYYSAVRKRTHHTPEAKYDLVFVLPPVEHHGWILDAICREIDTYCNCRTALVPYKETLPPSHAYFYSHYGYLRETIRRQPDVMQRRNLLFYTHPKKLWYRDEELYYLMNTTSTVVSMCSTFADYLVRNGVRQEQVEVAIVGADPEMFTPHARGKGKIGFCSGYVPRKGGDRIIELVRSMPDEAFILCGKKWRAWDRFGELEAMPNLEYIEIPYQQYPDFYASIDIFLSVSQLEGGPIPLIESAMCNVVPVCSRTGHAPDIIQHGENGFLFDPAAGVNEICRLISSARQLSTDVRSTVEHLTWERFSRQIQNIAGIEPAISDNQQTEAA